MKTVRALALTALLVAGLPFRVFAPYSAPGPNPVGEKKFLEDIGPKAVPMAMILGFCVVTVVVLRVQRKAREHGSPE